MDDHHHYVEVRGSDSLLCDFCTVTPAVCFFPSSKHVLEEVPGVHETGENGGGWCACSACARLVEGRNLDRLVARALRGMRAVDGDDFTPELRRLAKRTLQHLYGKLFPCLGPREGLPQEDSKLHFEGQKETVDFMRSGRDKIQELMEKGGLGEEACPEEPNPAQ